jgi:polyhydroxybutyrate depolymerase
MIKMMQQQRLWLGLACVVLVGISFYASAKLVRRYLANQPRSGASGYLQIGNFKRAYDLHVPAAYKSNQPAPLLIALHGTGGNGNAMKQQTGFNQLAEQKGFIVVYPDGVKQHWDARRGNQPETTNDVGFITALIDDLENRYSIDRRRIYATGFSNGGTFTYRLACELSDKIAAIAVVSATMPANLTSRCQTTKPLPVLLIHGTKDEAIPYATAGRGLLSVPDTFKYWSTHNRCSSLPKELPPTLSGVQTKTYGQCANQTSVVLHSIQGGGHEWASDAKAGDSIAKQFSASAVIWDFFNQYTSK